MQNIAHGGRQGFPSALIEILSWNSARMREEKKLSIKWKAQRSEMSLLMMKVRVSVTSRMLQEEARSGSAALS